MAQQSDPGDSLRHSGDMSTEDFRRYGYQVVDWIARYFETIESRPVLPNTAPGEITSALPHSAPSEPESMDEILQDFDRIILPGITHWNHPAFFAYFAVTGSLPGALGEFLSAALNVNAMLWRTSPAATELETVTLDWLRQLLGLPDQFEGVVYDTASISSLVAISAAREAIGRDIRQRGLSGRHDMPLLRLYCSEEAHSSIEKAAITLGIGLDGVCKIPTDRYFRMDTSALAAAIDDDRATGHLPFCVVATVGTTSSTSIDPVSEIASIAHDNNLWLHVDASYGGIAAIVPEMRWVLRGVEEADSLVTNPHKWLFTQIDFSAFYSRHLDRVKQAFTIVPEYLRTDDDATRNYMDYGPQLGRRFRALKLWFVLRSFGRDGIVQRLREHIYLARMFATWIETSPDWEMMAAAPFSTVCFRASPAGAQDTDLDEVNQRIMNRVNERGNAYISHTSLRGQLTLRLAIGNIRTEERHIRLAWDSLQQALGEICQELKFNSP